jgi:DNA-directed RNA polymerase specialized sigma24 family protein
VPVTFEQFVAVSSSSLVRAARMLLGDAAEAEDMAQETLIVMHQHWARLRNPDAAQACATGPWFD